MFRPFLCSLGLLATTLVAQGPAGVDPANLDRTVKPCEDFFQFANGGWLKANPLPEDRSRYGAFEEIGERNRAILRTILEETSGRRDWKAGSIQQQVGDYYASGMNEAAIERKGRAPLQPYFKQIEALTQAAALPGFLAAWHQQGLPGAFRFSVGQDAKASTRYLGSLGQGGTGLPDRDYYLKDDARSKDIRTRYEAHVGRMFELLGSAPAAAKTTAAQVVQLERRLAELQWTRVDLRNPNKVYNKRTLDQLAAEAPGFDWSGYFKARGLAITELNLAHPPFFTGLAQVLRETPLDTLRAYFKWHLVNATSDQLPNAFAEEAFAFRGKVLSGTPVQEPRWKRVQAEVDGSIGEALGQLYVAKAFSPEAKKKVLEMVGNMRGVLRERIQNLEWMGPETKQQALRKLDAFNVKMGFPDRWKHYDFPVKREDYFGNMMRAASWQVKENLARLGQPIDRAEWGMTPSTVNAYYSQTLVEIVFPAGILQPPFFDPKADDAVNYGAIGWVIGHEMTHGFDDRGSQFDAEGNLKNWWTEADRKAYDSRTDLMVKQYNAYEPLPGEHVNGKLTLGENIADLGGLKIAFAAWQRSLGGKPAPAYDGFTGAQRFFLGSAAVWRNHIRDAALSLRLKTDSHSPGRQRVRGPLSNLPEFFDAFGCEDGSPMKRDAQVRPAIW